MTMKILVIVKTIIDGLFIFNGHLNRKCNYKYMGINSSLIYCIESNGLFFNQQHIILNDINGH